MERENEVVIDADFFQSTTQLGDGDFFKAIMDAKNVAPVMHVYVAEIELKNNEVLRQLLAEGYIRIIKYEEFLKTEVDRMKYQADVWQLCEDVNEEEIPEVRYRDIYRKDFSFCERNMGEIMSELMAKTMQLPLFLSNDNGAKRVATRYINSSRYKVEVKNLMEVLSEIGNETNSLKWKDIKLNLNQTNFKNRKDDIRHLWVND
jgi:hypothetical protein